MRGGEEGRGVGDKNLVSCPDPTPRRPHVLIDTHNNIIIRITQHYLYPFAEAEGGPIKMMPICGVGGIGTKRRGLLIQ